MNSLKHKTNYTQSQLLPASRVHRLAGQLELERTPGTTAVSAEDNGRTGHSNCDNVAAVSSPSAFKSSEGLSTSSTSSGYKEYVAFPALDVQIETKKKEAKKRCDGAILLLTCPKCGDTYIKTLYCGRPFCHVCGQEWSAVHQRKFSTVLPKAKKFASMGYLDIEWPRRYRNQVAYGHDIVKTVKKGRTRGEVVDLDVCTKEGLRNVSNVVVRVLGGKRTGAGRVGGYFDNGIIAWHWFGDYYGLIKGERFNVSQLDKKNYATDFNELLDSVRELCIEDLVLHPNTPKTLYIDNAAGDNSVAIDKLVTHFAKKYHFAIKPYSAIEYNPHLNVLVPGAFIDNLETIKADLRRELECPDLIVHYNYVDTEGQMVNKLKYILRATYLDEAWFPKLRHELYNFRNVRYWGKWDIPTAWHTTGEEMYETIGKLERCECPNCHVKLKASPVTSSKQFALWQAHGRVQALGASYFKLLKSDDGRPDALDMGDLLPAADYDKSSMMQRARGDALKVVSQMMAASGDDYHEVAHQIHLAKRDDISLDYLKSTLPEI